MGTNPSVPPYCIIETGSVDDVVELVALLLRIHQLIQLLTIWLRLLAAVTDSQDQDQRATEPIERRKKEAAR